MQVVWVSDYSGKLVHTGYSGVSANILPYLHKQGHKVFEIGAGYQGPVNDRPWPVFSPNAHGGRLEGQDLAPLIAKQAQADVLVLFMDPPDAAWAVTYMDRAGNMLSDEVIEAIDKRTFALCAYTPVDGQCPDGSLPRKWQNIFQNIRTFDAMATPSKFGQHLMSETFGKPVAHLPHGVDTEVFHPLQEGLAVVRGRLGLPPENLTLLYVAVNKRRKMVPAFFETAAKVLERVPSLAEGTHPVYKGLTVIFHGDDREENFDLEGLETVYGLDRPNVVTYHTQHLTTAGLAQLYNTADIFVGLSGGEGFMVPAIEAQACRVATMVTGYSAMAEIVPDAEMGWCKVPPAVLVPQPFNLMMWAWPDTDLAAEKIVMFVEDKGLRMRLRKACWENAQGYAWPNVLPRIERWLEESVEIGKNYPNRIRVEAINP